MATPHWTEYFDRIFLINLESRDDRLMESVKEIKKYHIPFVRYEAIYDENGALGLYSTMMKLFKECLDKKYDRILVFEDDIHLLLDPTPIMKLVAMQKKPTWDLIYLGCNLPDEVTIRQYQNFMEVRNAYSTHAVCYSKSAMQKLLRAPMELPYDIMLINTIQKEGNSYCTYPMLASQRANWSDIEKKFCDYSDFLEKRFNQNVKIQT